MASYKIIAGSKAEAFHNSRAKIRLYGGGFANGKTTALVAEIIKIARDYPGCSILAARATYPKLNSTLRKEFEKWCPKSWIKSFDRTKDNVCTLINGTTIDFRYIDQRTDSDGEGTSNLLSANYDFIVVDQIDDVEITHEDFLQLLGRLRGNTPYAGEDPTMPRTGPRMIALSCNPTLGWPYKKLVKPIHDHRAGRHNEDLICVVNADGTPELDADGKAIPLIEVFEATTYENAQNLAPDYIRTLEATYTGKMRDRYLLGKWVAFTGTVYENFDENRHVVPHAHMVEHLQQLRLSGYRLNVLEGYDLGLTEPSCYLFAQVDAEGVLYFLDGFYEPLKDHDGIEWQAEEMQRIRAQYMPDDFDTDFLEPWADPAIFKRTNAARKVTETTAEMFRGEGIYMRRGNNDILKGVIKVRQYLQPRKTVINPFTHELGAPMLYVSDKLHWMISEFTTWRWKRGDDDNSRDQTVDKNNHAMDALRYMLTETVVAARLHTRKAKPLAAQLLKWNEQDRPASDRRSHRYS